jgi:hypothetical protein
MEVFLLVRRWWLSLSIAAACVLSFGVILASTMVGQQAVNTLRFVFGWQHIAQQQQQLVRDIQAAFQAAGFSAELLQRGMPISQRRGREYWQRQTYTVQIPPGVSLDLGETILRETTHRLHLTVLRRQERRTATHASVALTIGIAGVPTTIFWVIQSRAPAPSGGPRMAIIIDDLGWDLETAQALLTFEVPLSFAVLPNTPYRAVIAQEAQRRGRDVLLHLPMEPYNYPDVDPGQPALLSTMNAKELAAQIGAALQALPTAIGVNNHMGSRLTENREVMQSVMQQMKYHNLFFLDSRTTPNSLAYQVAREMGVPTAQRQVFLDNELDTTKIQQQLRHLATLAHARGSAIGIGHPYPETVRALRTFLPTLRQDGIEIVPVSQLVR